MKRKNLVILVTIVLILIVGILAIVFNNKGIILQKEKLYSFDEYNLLKNTVNLVSNQEDADIEFLTKIENEDYTISNPLIIVNPYDISPLTALIGFKTTNKTTVKITIHGKDGGKDLVYYTKEQTIHHIPIYGLYMDYNNQVTLELSDGTKNIISIPAETPYSFASIYFPDVEVITNNLDENDNDFYFLSTPVGHTAAAFDQKGEIRWLLTNQVYKQLSRLENGHLLVASPEAMEDKSLGLLEIDLLGKVYNTYELKYPYFHNYTELPGNKILYSTDDNKIIKLNLKTGEVEKTFDIFAILSEIDSSHMNSIKDNFGYINALYYDESSETVLIGIYYYSTLINMDLDGKINWILADPDYYSAKFDKYLLKPTGTNFIYPKGNFNAKLNNNKLTLMNNGWDLTDTWSCSKASGLTSTANDYTIDPSKKNITEDWRYGNNFFSFTFGDYYTDENEKTIMFGREFRSYHTNMSECILSDEGDFYSSIITLKNDVEVFKMTVSNTYNYVSKMSIFDENYTFAKVMPNSFTADQISDSYKEEDYAAKFKKAIAYSIPLELSGNKLKVLFYEEGYNVILIDEYGKGYVYKEDNRTVNLKKGTGKNLILIEWEGNLYNTGYYINN